ncbi:MAG: caspase family protein [Thiomargarita sp.]|nr:caspase family protein [Bacteroidales bacterium]MCK5720395.1 caspase family protein [Thiomargarita sp.]
MLRYLLILIVVLTIPVQAARLALVIGNGGYNEHLNGLELTYLPHAVNDAKDMAEVLYDLGFEIILVTDVNKKAMKKAIRKFGKRLKTFTQDTDIGLFYYSGHGFQYNEVNYLVPLEVDIEHEIDIEDEALKADYMLRFMKYESKAINIVILDACRTSIKNVLRKKKGFFDDVLPGLAEMEAPVNSLIAYATQPNKDAKSGRQNDNNSLYTKHLLATLRNKPYLDVAKLFTTVRNQVMMEAENEDFQQIPWEQTSLQTNFCFGKCESPIINDNLLVLESTREAFTEHVNLFLGLVLELDKIGGSNVGKHYIYKTVLEKKNAENETQKKILTELNSIQTKAQKLVLLSVRYGKREKMELNVNSVINELNKVINMLGTNKEERKSVSLDVLYSSLANIYSLTRMR